ncbi:oligosaccharide flippase family protein [Labilibaculum euxinus]
MKALMDSKAIRYVVVKYMSFIIKFINSILIAKFLGPFYFGIYSFTILVQQYYSYSNLGINFSTNTLISIKKNKTDLTDLIWRNSLVILIFLSIVICAVGVILTYLPSDTLSKYSFQNYSSLLSFIAIITFFNFQFQTIYRIYGKIVKINFHEYIIPLLVLFSICIFREKLTVYYILISIFIGNLFALLLYFWNSPKPFRLSLNFQIAKTIVIRGLNLLMYNISFYFILISSRTLVSYYYSVEELANYSFANSLSATVMMVGGAFSFIFYPKLVNFFNKETNFDSIQMKIEELRNLYIGGLNFIAILSIVLIPLLTFFIGDFTSVLNIFKLLIIAQICLNYAFGYTTFLIAKNKESILTKIGFISVFIVVLVGVISVYASLPVVWFSVSVVIGCIVFTSLTIYVAKKILNQNTSIVEVICYLFPIRKLIPMLIIIFSVILNEHILLPILTLCVYVLLNYSELKTIFYKGVQILGKENVLDF